MKEYFFVSLIGLAVLILFGRGILGRKALLICGGLCFLVGVVLFGYFFYQIGVYSQEECLFENGCMNEFGGFILFPISALAFAAILWLATIILPFRKKPNPKQEEKQAFATGKESFTDAGRGNK